MKKVFYTCLTIFLITGISLFYLIDKNYVKFKSSFEEKSMSSSISINSDDERVTLEKEYNTENEKLDIKLGVGDVVIESYDGKFISIKSIVPKKSLKDYKVSNENKKILINGSIAEKVVVKVPKDIILEGNFNVGVGNISAENLKNVIIELSTGDFQAKNIDSFERINVNLGNIKISDSKNISTIKMGAGDIDLNIVEQTNNFVIENKMGDIDLSITNKFDGNVDSNVSLGDIRPTNLKIN